MKQHNVANEFKVKITKAFVDTLYTFLDGMVNLASEEHLAGLGGGGEKGLVQLPMTSALSSHVGASTDLSTAASSNAFDQLDFSNVVRLGSTSQVLLPS